MGLSPAAILYATATNAIKYVVDGSDYLLATISKLRNVAGDIVNPATEGKQDDGITKLTSLDGKDFATQATLAAMLVDTGQIEALLTTIDADTSNLDVALSTIATETKLELVRALLATIDADTSNLDVALSTRATEATLALADGRLTTIDAVLDSIKDADGIKKITDQLPAGTNNIGDVDVASSALPAGAATETTLASVLVDTGQIEALLTTIDADTGNLDVALSTVATEVKLETVRVLLASLDGKDYATQTTLATLATEAKLEAVRVLLASLDNKDFATQTTLLAVDGRLTTIDAVLDSIKDTDGIKKIDEGVQLQAGTNEIGKVAQGTKAAAADAWPQALYDAAGHAVGVVLDGVLYRLQTDSKVAKGTSALVTLDAIDTAAGLGRLKTTLYTPDGDAVTFGSVPPSPESIVNAFALNGSSSDLLVDADPTPAYFDYLADPDHDISLQEIAFVISSNSITFGSDAFGGMSGPLTNGVKVEVTADGETGTIALLKQNEDLVHFASPGGFNWVVSSKDMLATVFVIGGGLKLKAGTADKVRITIQDDIDSAGVYFKCFVKGSLLQ